MNNCLIKASKRLSRFQTRDIQGGMTLRFGNTIRSFKRMNIWNHHVLLPQCDKYKILSSHSDYTNANLIRKYHKSVTPTLYCAATPIGNLGDLTDRFKEHLQGIPNIICENTLTAARLMHALDIPTRGKKFIQYAEDKKGETFSERKIQTIVKHLVQGQDCMYISEAGSPCISDPGYQLVNRCLESGYRVSVLPGASSITAALMVSGINGNKFIFEGFLDKRQKKRIETLKKLHTLERTVVLFENPTRLRQTIQDIESVYSPNTQVAICKELTKKHEEVIRGKLSQFQHLLPSNVDIKGEIVIVISGENEDS